MFLVPGSRDPGLEIRKKIIPDPDPESLGVKSSVAEPELHLLVGAGALMRCGSGS
jgi:hypothetical protein